VVVREPAAGVSRQLPSEMKAPPSPLAQNPRCFRNNTPLLFQLERLGLPVGGQLTENIEDRAGDGQVLEPAAGRQAGNVTGLEPVNCAVRVRSSEIADFPPPMPTLPGL
jgi:hypothetical protein